MKRLILILLLALISTCGIKTYAGNYYFECPIDCPYGTSDDLPFITMTSTSAAITSEWYDRLTLDENGIARYPDAKVEETIPNIRRGRGLDTGDGDSSIGRDLPLGDVTPWMILGFVLAYLLRTYKTRTRQQKDKTSCTR